MVFLKASVCRQGLSDSRLNVYSICVEGQVCFVFEEQQRIRVREGGSQKERRRRMMKTDKTAKSACLPSSVGVDL